MRHGFLRPLKRVDGSRIATVYTFEHAGTTSPEDDPEPVVVLTLREYEELRRHADTALAKARHKAKVRRAQNRIAEELEAKRREKGKKR